MASLGASSSDIKRLATCYWHSVEFGLLKEKSKVDNNYHLKAYGAGLLSSIGELEYSCKNDLLQENAMKSTSQSAFPSAPALMEWDPNVASETPYPITEYQPIYFVAESLADAKVKMRSFCESLPRPFYARYNRRTGSVWVDRAVKVLQIVKSDSITG